MNHSNQSHEQGTMPNASHEQQLSRTAALEQYRKAQYKSSIDASEARRARQATTISIRKAKREQGLAKRRHAASSNPPSMAVDTDGATAAKVVAPSNALCANAEDMHARMVALRSNDGTAALCAARDIRKALSSAENPPVAAAVASGVLPILASFLRADAPPQMMFESAWALTNVASADSAATRAVVDAGAVPGLVLCLMAPDGDIREQCAWCLGNIAGDGADLRDVVLGATAGGGGGRGGGSAHSTALGNLLANVCQPATPSLLRNAVWCLSNFCRGKRHPALATIAPSLPVLSTILAQVADAEVLADACWALSYLAAEGDDAHAAAVVDSGAVPALLALLSRAEHAVVTPALRTLGNLVAGTDAHTQCVVDAGGAAALLPLLSSARRAVRKEACWALSNIAAGTAQQVAALADTPGLIAAALRVLRSDGWEIRKEAAWLLCNVACCGAPRHGRACIAEGAVPDVCELLAVADSSIVLVALDALDALLNLDGNNDTNAHGSADKPPSVAVLVDECGGIDRIEDLQQHENAEVYRRSVQLLERHFDAEDQEEDAGDGPGLALCGAGDSADGMFKFGFDGQARAWGQAQAGFCFNTSGFVFN